MGLVLPPLRSAANAPADIPELAAPPEEEEEEKSVAAAENALAPSPPTLGANFRALSALTAVRRASDPSAWPDTIIPSCKGPKAGMPARTCTLT